MVLRADISCKWTPISLQAEHFLFTIFWIPDGISLQVKLQLLDNLLVIILFPITVPIEDFIYLFVTLKFTHKNPEALSKIFHIIGHTEQPQRGRYTRLHGQEHWEVKRGVTHQHSARSCRPLCYSNSMSSASGSNLLRATTWR